MNYPFAYDALPGHWPGCFWERFTYRFTPDELCHLRHGPLSHVMPGARPFETGAAIFDSVELPAADDPAISGIRLEVDVPSEVLQGDPVFAQLQLDGPDDSDVDASHHTLDPADGLVRIAVCRPDGSIRVFSPLISHCLMPSPGAAGSPDHCCDLTYGKGGFTFTEPGTYRVVAHYRPFQGGSIASAPATVLVRPAGGTSNEPVVDGLFRHDTGRFAALQSLDGVPGARTSLENVLERGASPRVIAWIHRAMGVHLARDFKVLEGTRVRTRRADLRAAADHLAKALQIRGVQRLCALQRHVRPTE